MCPFCDRMVHPITAYRVKVGDHVVLACCPRCGMHAQVSQAQGNPGPASATDVNTGESVPAESATYVEGGDVQYCTHGDHPMTREPHGVSMREYDRCLPTLVAFKSLQEAEVVPTAAWRAPFELLSGARKCARREKSSTHVDSFEPMTKARLGATLKLPGDRL
jgi:hypothetical protein